MTIVTAYFKLKVAKASPETYTRWIKNMLDIDNEMVIFCDETSADMIRDRRSGKMDKTVILVTTIQEFYTYRYHTVFMEHFKMDTEKRIGHNPFLYMIWNEKFHFMKRAIELDPFRSNYFIWVDIGCFRVPNTRFIHWPNPRRLSVLDKSKVLVLSVVPFTEQEWRCNSLKTLPSFQHCNRIGAGIFGGGKEVMLKWHDTYYKMLEHFISIDRFIGKEQSIMNSVVLLNREMVDIVKWKQGCPDPWFYLQEYLSNTYDEVERHVRPLHPFKRNGETS